MFTPIYHILHPHIFTGISELFYNILDIRSLSWRCKTKCSFYSSIFYKSLKSLPSHNIRPNCSKSRNYSFTSFPIVIIVGTASAAFNSLMTFFVYSSAFSSAESVSQPSGNFCTPAYVISSEYNNVTFVLILLPWLLLMSS